MGRKAPSSNVEWKLWAKRDPLYAVATCPSKDKAGAAPWTDEEFYALGRSDWEDFHERWCRYGLSHQSCVEIGCGAGRITRQLAKQFETVHAFDISEEMLAYARRQVPDDNVHFHLSCGADIPLPDGSITSVFSCHVFQHFDSLAVARGYFEEIQRILVPDGTFMIHVPLYCWPYESLALRTIYRTQKRISDVKAALNRWLIRAGLFRPLMRRLPYPLEWFYSELPRLGFAGIELAVVAPKSSNDPHPFVLARKAAAPGRATAPLTEATTPRVLP